MKKQHLFMSILFFLSASLCAQYAGPEVLNAGGGVDRAGILFVQWSLGEIAVQTGTCSEGMMTEGFHQPRIIVERLEPGTLAPAFPMEADQKEQIPEITVFPNPVRSTLEVRFDTPQGAPMVMEVMTLSGKDVFRMELMPGQQRASIDLGHLPQGMYLLRIFDSEGLPMQAFRISRI